MLNLCLLLAIGAHCISGGWNGYPIAFADAAFAGGGFGGGGGAPGGAGSKGSKPTRVRNDKRGGGRVRKEPGPKEVTTVKPPGGGRSSAVDGTTGPKLDRWGLPAPTLDDIFPPMSDDTELRPVDPSKRYSLEVIQQCLRNHISLDLTEHFDVDGIGKNPNADGSKMALRLLHESPPVLTIDNFMTPGECRYLQSVSNTPSAHQVDSATFRGAISTRTSTSWFCPYSDVPVLLAKAQHCLNIPLEVMEEPQLVRYGRGQEFSWHYDEVPTSQLENGGQRLATLLVYLNTVPLGNGGGTTFRDLKQPSTIADGEHHPLVMQPREGSALLFFPAFADGRPDDRTLHKSEIMDWDEAKWIVQMWVHQRHYHAVLPRGNSNEAARSVVEDMSRKLGFTTS